ncbi:hypothetical protein RRG08_065541 [Elysia crispata]|uniref:Uncharacterized protein n=1 Tax=Elysia crispata TaxID=231223 RepID=A0AAE1ATR6_9GAST|nr:hypothetical protein RRG08_065541 [Elysia crispata]
MRQMRQEPQSKWSHEVVNRLGGSIATTKGSGRHVEYIADQCISKRLIEVVRKKNKGGVAIKPFQGKKSPLGVCQLPD